MKVAIGGLMHESNTFSKDPTGLDEFRSGGLHFGPEIEAAWGAAHHEVGGFFEGARAAGLEIAPTVMAWATPCGPVADAALDEIVERIIADCEREQIDGLLLALHGAMVCPGFPDADGEVLRRLRAALGPHRPIVATLDYHANVSELMAERADALIGYQTYPHIDQRECGLKSAALIARALRGEVRPVTVIAKPPLIINLLGQETDREPMRSLITAARDAERLPGMLSVSLMAGFPYADVPEMGPTVISVADKDRPQARSVATELADRLWQARDALDPRGPRAEEAVRAAIASDRRPVVLVDLGDNIGGGTPGNGTVLLRELIRQRAQNTLVVLHDPEAVQQAWRLGPGARFEAAVGGRGAPEDGGPVEVQGIVKSIHDGTWTEEEPRHGGRRLNDQGPTAVVELPGPITLVLNTLRTPPFSLGQLTSLGIYPASQAILVVKAAVAYKAAYGPIAGRVIEVDTPGITAIDPRRFTYRRIRRPIFPLDAL